MSREENRQAERRQWKSINGDPNLSPIVPEAFDFHKFIREPRIIASFFVSILGIAIAGLSIYIQDDTLRMIGCILGACISFGAVSQITGYINKRTAFEVQQRKAEKQGKKKK